MVRVPEVPPVPDERLALAAMNSPRPTIMLLASLPVAAAVSVTAGCHGRVATAAVTHRLMADQKAEKKLSTLREAHEAFYAGLNEMCLGNADALLAVWSRSADASDFGPDGLKHVGWQAVEAQFRKEAAMKMGGSISCEDARFVEGEGWGISTCTEVGRGMTIDGKVTDIRFRSTNVFRKEGKEWRLVHHHTDPAKPLAAPLK